MLNEQILVVPRSFLSNKNTFFQGFLSYPSRDFLEIISTGSFFMPRAKAESEPKYKQLIVYSILRYSKNVFVYQRTSGSSEIRLINKFSIGLGGHINPCRASSFKELIQKNLKRELLEEVSFKGTFSYHFLGAINDEQTEVGICHLGLVYLVSCSNPHIYVKEDNKLTGRFCSISEILNKEYEWESWSSLLIPKLKELLT
ncbi:MAG: hypothetical protein ACPLTR_06355 [Thermacetogeniaceae bacterium]